MEIPTWGRLSDEGIVTAALEKCDFVILMEQYKPSLFILQRLLNLDREFVLGTPLSKSQQNIIGLSLSFFLFLLCIFKTRTYIYIYIILCVCDMCVLLSWKKIFK